MAGEPSSTHDVFLLDLSESGTTKGNSGLLLEALRESRIRTFIIEDEELLPPTGDEITPALVTAIQASKIAIVVVTLGTFGNVSLRHWKVLIYILDYFQRNPQRIIPVHYIDHSGAHAEPYSLDEPSFYRKYNVWGAIGQLYILPGWMLDRPLEEYEKKKKKNKDEFNREIASQVSKILNRAPLPVAAYPVGIESRLKEVWSLLELRSPRRDVLSIGFYGMQGIGKSVLARAVYNSIAHVFEVSCFLDIRKNTNTHGLVGVQKKLLSEISGETDIQLEDVSERVSMIKDRLHQKVVLLILDNVDSLEQLEALGRGPGWWFSSGSRVIFTTQNKDLLTYHGNDMLLYEVQALNDKDALELLRYKAFGDGYVEPRQRVVLNRAIRYASGHPLVLDMIGSYWKGKRLDECKNALDLLERIPCNDIQSIQDALTNIQSTPDASTDIQIPQDALIYNDIQSPQDALIYNDIQSIYNDIQSPQDALIYGDIQSIQGASMTSPSVFGVSTPLIDTEGQTERNAGVRSQMDFQKVMLMLVFFASSVVGLLCNALSPPFKRSIRWWTLFKFFPFVVFFLAVVAIIRYLYRHRIIGGLIQSCICYGIFLCISIYSYFYDRAVDGKPGILSLVSNAMFALATLSLSKLFEAGFETGIFNYYLQCFMIQLLTFDWKLIFVAIIIAVPLFDWHFSVELFLINRIFKWFGINRPWNQNQNDKKAA